MASPASPSFVRSVASRARSAFRRQKPSAIDASAAAAQDERDRLAFEAEILAVSDRRMERVQWASLRNSAAARAAEPSPLIRNTREIKDSTAEIVKPPQPQVCHFEQLPTELVCAIAMRSGFFAALTLMQTSRRFYNLLSHRDAWANYMDPRACDDSVESSVVIMTKLSMFDQLSFGTWQGLPNGDTARAAEEAIFFEHRSFDEGYRFLGGLSMEMSRVTVQSISFFEHRELLPCYQADLKSQAAAGLLPPTIATTPPTGTPPTITAPIGTRIAHSCTSCAYYDSQKPRLAICLLDAVPSFSVQPMSGERIYTHAFAEGRRTLRVVVTPYASPVGYADVKDLPMIARENVRVAGNKLTKWEHDFFTKVVCR
ncbi:hypothetical protein HDU86_001182 [Geranomyces michiganensis]|nr:hypothetical protein HDU86_001182 [Geranomyces michiganensis]